MKLFRFCALLALFSLLLGSGVAELRAETESPSALDKIVLSIPSQQVVGRPWTGPVQLLLLDENLDLVTNYDLSVDPITLTVSDGSVSPAVISDPSLFSGGIVDLTALGLVYSGHTGPVTIIASNSTVISSGILVFNGYDLSKVIGLANDTVSTVYPEVETSVVAIVGNDGNLLAIEPPSLKAYFKSGGGSVKINFAAGSSGQVDTLVISLPTTGLAPGTDTLMLVTESTYHLGSDDLITGDTIRIPVQVLPSAGLTVVSGSLKPDSVYGGVLFDFALAVVADGMQIPFDSAVTSVSVLSDTDSVLAVIFDGVLQPDMIVADTLFYYNIPAEISTVPDIPVGRYALRTDYCLQIGGLSLRAVEPSCDSLTIIAPAVLTYLTSTLVPDEIASGAETMFQFEIQLDDPVPIYLSHNYSSFDLSCSGFSVEAQLSVPGDSLIPGNNLIRTESLYIPEELLDSTLLAHVSIVYSHAGVGNQLLIETNFDDEIVVVQEFPLIKIVETYIDALNTPKVNTSQAFKIACRVANISTTDSNPFELILATDGNSQFDSLLQVDGIASGGDTLVYFDVVASSDSNHAEVFRVEVAPFSVNHTLPDDNVAMAIVQRPAELAVSHLLVGTDKGHVNVGEEFDLIIGLVNTGDGDATHGRFRFNTNGVCVYLGLPGDSMIIEEVIPVGSIRGVSFIAPDFDTMFSIDVDLIELPIDINSGQTALIGDTTFQFNLEVTSPDLSLNIELAEVSSNLVVAGESKDLFLLRATNPGISSLSDIELESMTFRFKGGDNESARVWSLVEVGSTGLFYGDRKVTSSTAGEDRLKLLFDNFMVVAGQTIELSFRIKSLADINSEFTIVLNADDIVARYATGPLADQTVTATAPGDEQIVVEEVYTAVLGNLENSFAVRTNPFDPIAGPAEFRYYLEQSQQIRFLVLTLSGELVYERLFEADEMGGQAGENTLFWDGRNDKGQVVLNGVYVVVVSSENNREQAILKLAVLK
ncbi:MAG: hypothetical protein J7J98_00610 [candidate division Zixibacteria bacterium]|nr:hypothetical protein [candidate division Zixibacteria bacterium]